MKYFSNTCRNDYNKKAAMSVLRTKPKLARRRMKQNAVSACGHFGESHSVSTVSIINRTECSHIIHGIIV